jgi:DNA-binding HxlR family transcriptional regulator
MFYGTMASPKEQLVRWRSGSTSARIVPVGPREDTEARRTYGDACAAAHALDVVGERWALLVVRELLLGPKRFTDLRAGLPHVSPNVLGQRLRELERDGVVRRRKLGPPAGARVYELTGWGQQLEPVLTHLGRWGLRSPAFGGGPVSVDSLMLALRGLFDPQASGGLTASYQLRFGADRLTVRVGDGQIVVQRGEVAAPDVTLDTDPPTFAALLARRACVAGAAATGHLKLTGDARLAQRLFEVCPVPGPAPSAK